MVETQEENTPATKSKRIFNELDASEEAIQNDNGITELDSICMNCYKQVTHTLLNQISLYLITKL